MRTLKWEDWSCPDYNLQPQLAFYQNGNNTRVNVSEHFSFYSAIAIQHFLLFALVFSIFSPLITSDFLLPTKSSYKKHNSPDLSSIHLTRFLFKITQHCETWNMIGLFPSYKLEEIELILFFKSYITQIFLHQVCMNWLFYTVKLVESYRLHHTNCSI